MGAIRAVVAAAVAAGSLALAGTGLVPAAQAADPVVTITSVDFPRAPVAGKNVVVTGRVRGARDGTIVTLTHWVNISTRDGGHTGWYDLDTTRLRDGRYRFRTPLRSNRTKISVFVRGAEWPVWSREVTAPQPRPRFVDIGYGDRVAPRIPGQRVRARFSGRKGQLVTSRAYRGCGATVTRLDGRVVPRVLDTYRLPANGRYHLRTVPCWGETKVAATRLVRRPLTRLTVDGDPVTRKLTGDRPVYLTFRNRSALARIVPSRTSGLLSASLQGPGGRQFHEVDGAPLDVLGLGAWTVGPRSGYQDVPGGPGRYHLKVESYGDAAFTLRVNTPRARGTTSIGGPAVRLATGPDRGRQNSFTFSGTAGSWVSLDVRGRAWRRWSKDDQVLVAPSGAQVFSPRTTESPVFRLPETGSYRVLVTPTPTTGTGTVRVLPASSGVLPVDGTPVTATVAEPRHVAVLQLEGEHSDRFTVTGSSALSTWRADVLMDLPPDALCGGPLPGCPYLAERIDQETPAASGMLGRSFVVLDPAGTGTGSVEFRATRP